VYPLRLVQTLTRAPKSELDQKEAEYEDSCR
jgi:hypothetical protein